MDEIKQTKFKKKYIFYIVAVLVVALLAALPFIAEKAKNSSSSEASILTGTVETGTITKTLSGAGTLTDADATEIDLPDGVELTKYLVSNGDYVDVGDDLAAVDKVTVRSAISNVYSTMETLLDEMHTAELETKSDEITSSIKGTVKTIYAKAGDNVRDVMNEYGALAVLTDANGNDINVTGVTGTIDTVYITEGRSVYVGATMFYLTGVEDSGTLAVLAEKYNKYADLMARLYSMNESGTIKAEAAGVVTGIDEDAAAELARNYTTHVINASSAAYTSEGPVMEIIQAHEVGDVSGQGATLAEGEETRDEIFLLKVTSVSGPNPPDQILFTDAYPSYSPQFCQSGTDFDTCKEWADGLKNYTTISVGDIFQCVVTEEKNESGQWVAKKGVFTLLSSAQGGGQGGQGGQGQTGNTGSLGGGMSMGGASGTTSTGDELYSLTGTTIMSITPQEKMTITITIDELDILSVAKGDEATVTIDALTGRSFTGTVTAINTSGSNSGGNSKYTAEVTIEKDEDMLAGMNATATITVDTYENVTLIPVAALCEEGNRTVVYLSADSKSGELSNPVVVTTGVSDGESVEIKSGLTEGQSFSYEYYDTTPVVSGGGSGGFDLGSMMGGGGSGGRGGPGR